MSCDCDCRHLCRWFERQYNSKQYSTEINSVTTIEELMEYLTIHNDFLTCLEMKCSYSNAAKLWEKHYNCQCCNRHQVNKPLIMKYCVWNKNEK